MIRLIALIITFSIVQPVLADTRVGMVAIYSNGNAEKLISVGDGWSLWRDQRRREFLRSDLPYLPVMEYQKFPASLGGYTQKLVFGTPENLQPYGKSESVRFEMLKTRSGVSTKKYWQCNYTGKGFYQIDSDKFKTENFSCIRVVLKKDLFPRQKEKVQLSFSPYLGVIVDRTRTDSTGKKKRIRLIELLEPEEASGKRIARTIYKLRNSK